MPSRAARPPDAAKRHAARRRGEITEASGEGRTHGLGPFTGQCAGSIGGILLAAEIVRRLVTKAERALTGAAGLVRRGACPPAAPVATGIG